MNLHKLALWLIGILLAVPAGALPEVWVGTLAAHRVACTMTAVDGSNPEAVEQAGQAFVDRWPAERLEYLGPVFGKPAEVLGAITFCAQYFGSDTRMPEGLALLPAAAGPALFAYCLPSEAAACQQQLQNLLGDAWQGERWSRLRFGLVRPGTGVSEAIPARAELEHFVVEPDPLLTLPDAESELQEVGQLTVARLTEEDANRIRAELAKPLAAPESEVPTEPARPVP